MPSRICVILRMIHVITSDTGSLTLIAAVTRSKPGVIPGKAPVKTAILYIILSKSAVVL
jgi:hypothetical protein